MSEKYKQRSSLCLAHNNNIIIAAGEIADIQADQYETISSGASYTDRFNRQKQRQELEYLDMSTQGNCLCNETITKTEILCILNQCKQTCPGEDEI